MIKYLDRMSIKETNSCALIMQKEKKRKKTATANSNANKVALSRAKDALERFSGFNPKLLSKKYSHTLLFLSCICLKSN